ncbi:hypothetical protein [Aureibacter tunicatorum]|uniref:Beta-lactamase n=1 Tax=Aureibacter tunicatorum TaxID=866807 RepID=A0AAE4BUE3_9BACT|nr:hypothetical protein [Aureibacter tunicatorum]MDR6240642.1 hypothetical protein [Aureibacter tunicatorum]BDD06497.1 hypothetical protein AUTU_39800 [Aureibacter tunicatorum]
MKQFFILLAFALIFLHAERSYSQNVPARNWEKVQFPVFHGWDQGKLSEIQSYVIDSTTITGMMIVKEGKVIFDYGNISENSYIASCRKSIMAMLYGKYVADGTI